MAHQPTIPEGGKRAVWVYGYEIVPPQPQERLRTIRAILDREAMDAKTRAHTWEGRLVAEDHVTHILVVSDSPEQDLEVKHRIEAALRALEAGFSVTSPMAVERESLPPLAPESGEEARATRIGGPRN
ncbi:MAG TPA: hypothetical protein VMM35_00935 [Longimicrobiales bacterium]|nr:hypothetical protein [Longimicrobiales bacterium]